MKLSPIAKGLSLGFIILFVSLASGMIGFKYFCPITWHDSFLNHRHRPGEIFEHRNIANQVISTDMNLMAVLQYSVDVLNVKHIVVCGHYGCGGIIAALSKNHNGLIDNWLRSLRDLYRQYRKELDHLASEEEKWRRLVELNVQEQVFGLSMTSIVQEALDRHQEIDLHGWVYEIKNGLIRDRRPESKERL